MAGRLAAAAVFLTVLLGGMVRVGLAPEGAAGRPAADPSGEGRVRAGETDPTSVGMDPRTLDRLDALIDSALAAGAAPGAALAIGRHGRLVRLRGYGVLDREDRRPVTPTTLFDLASLTKVVGTTTAVALLVDEGRIDLDAPVVDYLPDWSAGDPRKRRVTVRDLLLHRAGLPPFRRWYLEMAGHDAYRRAIAREPLETAPGERTVYSDIGVLSLGLMVEEVSGKGLDRFLAERVFGPLGMSDTRFNPPRAVWDRVAPTELDEAWRGVKVRGVVHDENAYAMGGVAGHAGLFSTALDLAAFAQMMLDRGRLDQCDPLVPGAVCRVARPEPERLLESATVDRFTTRFAPGSSRALGWDTPEGRSSAGDFFTARAFGHTGFTGTSLWIDPELDLFVVLLTNRVNPTRENGGHVPLRRAVHDLAAQAVRDRPVFRRAGSPPSPGAPR